MKKTHLPALRYRRALGARIIILSIVLLLVIAGAVWEFGFTLPGYRNALDRLEEISKANMAEVRTRADVVKQIALQPVNTSYSKLELSGGDETVFRHQRTDEYQWTRLMPGKEKLVIKVTYDQLADSEESESFDPASCGDEAWVFKSFFIPGNAPATVTVKARKRPVEESVFITLDEDANTMITDNELSVGSSIRKQMELFDPDGDGNITMDEFREAVRKLEEKKGDKLSQDELYEFFGGRSPGQNSSLPGSGPPGAGKKGGRKGKAKESDSGVADQNDTGTTEGGDAGSEKKKTENQQDDPASSAGKDD